MKKNMILISILFLFFNVFAEEYSMYKIAEYEQEKENGLFLRKYEEWAPYEDDLSAQYLMIDESGNKYIYQVDYSRMMFLDKNNNIKQIEKLNKGKFSYQVSCKNETFYFDGYYGYLEAIDFENKIKFKISMSKILGNSKLLDYSFYYDEESDILFLQDKNKQLYSIIHPGLDEEQNKKNFKTPEETSREFENGKTVNGVNVKVVDSRYLYINNNFVYFGQEKVGNYVYTKNREDYFLYNKNTKEYFNIYFSSEDEELESSAVHPSGDIYVLRMNWTTNTHNLYRIENTWDPQWRAQWYKEHPEAE